MTFLAVLDLRRSVSRTPHAMGFSQFQGIQTAATLEIFILAMLLYPDVMRRAQSQIDTVVGRGRLPSFSDKESLPYIDAIVKEVLRWRPVGPLALPRFTTQVRVVSLI